MPTKQQERYLNVIHIIRYENNTLQQLSASTCFKTIVRLMHSIRIKQALGVNRMNRYKRNGYRFEENWPKLCNEGQF